MAAGERHPLPKTLKEQVGKENGWTDVFLLVFLKTIRIQSVANTIQCETDIAKYIVLTMMEM